MQEPCLAMNTLMHGGTKPEMRLKPYIGNTLWFQHVSACIGCGSQQTDGGQRGEYLVAWRVPLPESAPRNGTLRYSDHCGVHRKLSKEV